MTYFTLRDPLYPILPYSIFNSFFFLLVFTLFLDYLYCIEDPTEDHGLTPSVAPMLLHLAIHYQVQRLVDDIEDFFIKKLSQLNLLQVKREVEDLGTPHTVVYSPFPFKYRLFILPLLQYHDLALESGLKRLLKNCRRMLTHSPVVIESGFQRGVVDAQQVVDILSMTSLPMTEAELFGLFVDWCHLHEEEECLQLFKDCKVGQGAKRVAKKMGKMVW